MDVVMLPLVPENASVAEALAHMRRHQRGGVIVQRANDRHELLYAGDLLHAKASRVKSVREVPNAKPVVLLNPLSAKKFRVDIVRPHRTAGRYETMLGKLEVDYSMVGGSNDTAMIVTISELMTRMLLTGGFRCNGTPRHFFPEPPVRPGQTCPKYPLCHVSGGGKPKIEPA